MSLKCGTSILDVCVGVTVPYTDAGFKLFVGEAVSAATGIISISFQVLASTLTENKARAFNALRCAIMNGGFNAWNFISSAWWYFSWFNLNFLIENLLDNFYPVVCTCLADVTAFAAIFGTSGETSSIFSTCSEAAEAI